jgi:hypothetical protein
MKTKTQGIELVRAAFVQAQRKLGPNALTMTLAVLNNRLFDITDRRSRRTPSSDSSRCKSASAATDALGEPSSMAAHAAASSIHAAKTITTPGEAST